MTCFVVLINISCMLNLTHLFCWSSADLTPWTRHCYVLDDWIVRLSLVFLTWRAGHRFSRFTQEQWIVKGTFGLSSSLDSAPTPLVNKPLCFFSPFHLFLLMFLLCCWYLNCTVIRTHKLIHRWSLHTLTNSRLGLIAIVCAWECPLIILLFNFH